MFIIKVKQYKILDANGHHADPWYETHFIANISEDEYKKILLSGCLDDKNKK